MARLQQLGTYLRYDSALKPRLREMVILLTAREWTQQYEWHVHVPLAFEHGLSPRVVRAIAEGRRPRPMARDETVLWDFFMHVQRTRGVSDATYPRGGRAGGGGGGGGGGGAGGRRA